MENHPETPEALSPWWRRSVLLVMMFGFVMLGLMSLRAYESAPPIPDKTVEANGELLFTGDDVLAGQEVFLKYGLMDNGTIWGHGGMLGPDFSAQTLHGLRWPGRRPSRRSGSTRPTGGSALRTRVRSTASSP